MEGSDDRLVGGDRRRLDVEGLDEWIRWVA
jgi:hypothetical protein